MKDHFSLAERAADSPVIQIPTGKFVYIPLHDHVLSVSKGEVVNLGTEIALHPDPMSGELHSPVSGKVTRLDFCAVHIKVDGKEGAVFPREISDKPVNRDLLYELQELGIDIKPLVKSRMLVINGMNPEPGITVPDQLLRDEQAILQDGLELAKGFIQPEEVVLAVCKGCDRVLTGCHVKKINPTYPCSLDPLVVREVTNQEYPEDVTVMSVFELFRLGEVVRSGMPVTDTILTFNGLNYRAKIGTPIREVLEAAGEKVTPQDRVILGGPFRGRAECSTEEGIDKDTNGMFVIHKDAFPPIADAPCINCGECVEHCPSRIQPSLISKYAEYDYFEKCQELGLDCCFECGLCSYHCIARRPVLQYIRFAKQQIEILQDKQQPESGE
ncbi:MAG: electron transporter RnfC [Desulfovibrio sp.]